MICQIVLILLLPSISGASITCPDRVEDRTQPCQPSETERLHLVALIRIADKDYAAYLAAKRDEAYSRGHLRLAGVQDPRDLDDWQQALKQRD